MCLLVKRGADPLIIDKNNNDPIMIAEKHCQPNIVTILRVAKMNNELKEQDMTCSGDPMFDQILKDLLTLTANEESECINDAPSEENSENKKQNLSSSDTDNIKLYSLEN